MGKTSRHSEGGRLMSMKQWEKWDEGKIKLVEYLYEFYYRGINEGNRFLLDVLMEKDWVSKEHNGWARYTLIGRRKVTELVAYYKEYVMDKLFTEGELVGVNFKEEPVKVLMTKGISLYGDKYPMEFTPKELQELRYGNYVWSGEMFGVVCKNGDDYIEIFNVETVPSEIRYICMKNMDKYIHGEEM